MQILFDAIIAFLCCVGAWALWGLVMGYLHYSDQNDSILKDERYEWMNPQNTMK